jgi:hypothetical protein
MSNWTNLPSAGAVNLGLMVVLGLMVAGCELAPPLVITGFVEGISLNQTGKTASDHVASLISGEDCSVIRYTKTGNYCQTAAEIAQEQARLHKPYEGNCYKRRGGVVCDDAADQAATSEISVYP